MEFCIYVWVCVCVLYYFCKRSTVIIIQEDGFRLYNVPGAGCESQSQGCEGDRQPVGHLTKPRA